MSKLLQEDEKYTWHPFTQVQTELTPLPIIKAKDATLFAEDGRTYLDCNSSWWVNTHGHGNQYIKEALIKQFDEIDHVIFAGVTHPKAVELSKRILDFLPINMARTFFSDDGSTAIEVALKMVFQYWHNKNQPKVKMMAMEGAYHGDTFGAMSIGQRGYFNKPFEHLFFDVDFMAFPTEDKEAQILKDVENQFKTNEFAGLIVEPLIQGSAGMCMYRPEFLEALFVLAKKYEVLIICDEVMTGWGRTGKMFALEYIESQPDIICLSKGLTAGVMSLGLTVTTSAIFDAFLAPEKTKALLHGHSYTANALACAVACANFDLIEKPFFFENIKRITDQHAAFRNRIKAHSKLKEVRQLGTIIAFEVQLDESDSSYFSSIRDEAYQFFLSKGLLIRPLGNVFFLNPPYCSTSEELEKMYAGITDFLNQLN